MPVEPAPKPATLIANEIPDAVYSILADMDFLFDGLGLNANDKIRYMGLFMYMRIQETPHAITPSRLTKVLSALHAAHETYRQPPEKKDAA